MSQPKAARKIPFMTRGPIATFSSIELSTAEDWALIGADLKKFGRQLPERIIAHLKLLEGDFGGFPVDRLHHSLLTATFARQDGRDDEYVACALLHDIGDTLGTFNHPDVAAAILKPFISDENYWMVEKHGIFQGYYFFHHIGIDRNMREKFHGHPCFARTAHFCEKYDAPAFDATAECFPLAAFESVLNRVFENPKNTLYRSLNDRS
jgi:predicted HD phosphohydrolase